MRDKGTHVSRLFPSFPHPIPIGFLSFLAPFLPTLYPSPTPPEARRSGDRRERGEGGEASPVRDGRRKGRHATPRRCDTVRHERNGRGMRR